MFNQWTGVGRLSAAPETRSTGTGKQVTTFTLCCDSGWGDNKRTLFIKIITWEKTAEACGNFLDKGSLCMVQGELVIRPWDDNEGNKKYSTEVNAREVKFLSPKSESSGGYEAPQHSTGEDLPF